MGLTAEGEEVKRLIHWFRAWLASSPDPAFNDVFAKKGGHKPAKFGPYDQQQAEKTWRQRQGQSPSGRPYAGPDQPATKVIEFRRAR